MKKRGILPLVFALLLALGGCGTEAEISAKAPALQAKEVEAPAVEKDDFGAKTNMLFVTHGGSGLRSTREAISELQPGAFISDKALSIERDELADSEEEIRQWAKSLNLSGDKDMSENNNDTVAGAAVKGFRI